MEKYYVFIKNNRVQQVGVFALQDEIFAKLIAAENGFDDAVWVDSLAPAMWSTYDGNVFIAPTEDYLYEIGIAQENTAMRITRQAKEAADSVEK